jgi:DNA-binding response OmpR family regulator
MAVKQTRSKKTLDFVRQSSETDRMADRIFIVEDDPDISRLLQVNLANNGYAVRSFTSSAPALAEALPASPALFLLDIMLPGGDDGLSLCKRIRGEPSLAHSRIIFVTAKSAETDRVVGLEIGADEYITKPFSPRELVARVKAVLRSRGKPEVSQMVFGDLEIDRHAMLIRLRGEPVVATTTEFRLIEALALAQGRVVTRSRLLELVWGSYHVDPHSIDVYISRLRSKIEDDPENPAYLQTVRGLGYRFEVGLRPTREA